MRPLGSKLAPPLLELVPVLLRGFALPCGRWARSPTALPPPLSGHPLLAPVLRVYETGAMRPLFAQLLRAKVFSETGLSPRKGLR